jgi:hypothetical protein
MNRTVEDATLRTFRYPDLEALQAHIPAFVTAFNSAKHLKALQWRTTCQASARPGKPTRQPSRSTHTTSSRDHTMGG